VTGGAKMSVRGWIVDAAVATLVCAAGASMICPPAKADSKYPAAVRGGDKAGHWSGAICDGGGVKSSQR
jgi:hypothetical protein